MLWIDCCGWIAYVSIQVHRNATWWPGGRRWHLVNSSVHYMFSSSGRYLYNRQVSLPYCWWCWQWYCISLKWRSKIVSVSLAKWNVSILLIFVNWVFKSRSLNGGGHFFGHCWFPIKQYQDKFVNKHWAVISTQLHSQWMEDEKKYYYTKTHYTTELAVQQGSMYLRYI